MKKPGTLFELVFPLGWWSRRRGRRCRRCRTDRRCGPPGSRTWPGEERKGRRSDYKVTLVSSTPESKPLTVSTKTVVMTNDEGGRPRTTGRTPGRGSGGPPPPECTGRGPTNPTDPGGLFKSVTDVVGKTRKEWGKGPSPETPPSSV